jgi:organic hydroperoxide reductase OsmC/OhrA
MQLEVSFRQIAETGAALGRAGSKTVVADRPAGKAGGLGLGLSGGELQALALGAGYCNQLRFSADQLSMEITDLAVDVRLQVDGTPALVTGAEIDVRVEISGSAADLEQLLAHAQSESSISNSVMRGFPVRVRACQ